MSGTGWFRWDGPDLVLQLHVQPRASREGLADVGPRGLKVRLTAAPADGKANEALQNLLSRAFEVPKAHIVLEKGASTRIKQVRIHAPRRLPAVLSDTKHSA
ncbi:MAG TPA: DUF167 family protein [Burkholderiales bacterium]|nr:DUF167 family protein [Burkholderiales bacterium]